MEAVEAVEAVEVVELASPTHNPTQPHFTHNTIQGTIQAPPLLLLTCSKRTARSSAWSCELKRYVTRSPHRISPFSFSCKSAKKPTTSGMRM